MSLESPDPRRRRDWRLAVGNSAELGRYLTDDNGRPVYVFSGDFQSSSTCNDECAKQWIPLSATPTPVESDEPAIQVELVGTIRREDGIQMSYAGRPLYARSVPSGGTLERSISDRWGTWSLVFPHGEPMVPLSSR